MLTKSATEWTKWPSTKKKKKKTPLVESNKILKTQNTGKRK